MRTYLRISFVCFCSLLMGYVGPLESDAQALPQARDAAPKSGGTIVQVGPECNETCPDDQTLVDVCNGIVDNYPKDYLSCTPYPNEDGDACWVEDYGHENCPYGYVVQCWCWENGDI